MKLLSETRASSHYALRPAWRWVGIAVALLSIALGRVHAEGLADLVEKVEPAVVRLELDNTLGSGVIIDPSGIVATNYHVIDGASEGKAIFRDGTTEQVAGYLAIHRERDIALLQLENRGRKKKSWPSLALAAKPPRKG